MLEHKNIEKMTAKDLAGVYSEIAEQIGVEDTYKLYLYFRGQQFSFPLNFESKEYVVSNIINDYDGKNIRSLARKYGYSESRVRQIIRKSKANE